VRVNVGFRVGTDDSTVAARIYRSCQHPMTYAPGTSVSIEKSRAEIETNKMKWKIRSG
jgi:hypothetical protein